MANLNEYKCPRCSGALRFDAKSGMLVCPFCDSQFELSDFEDADSELGSGYDEEDGFLNDFGNTWADGETEGLYTYVCKSCGGEIVGDATMAATSCPYCGNPVVVMEAFEGMLKPDYVIPFKLDKDQAVKALGNHLQGKRLLPKVFRDQNKIKEIKGIYVPFWIFDTDTFGDYEYETTKVKRWSDKYYDYKKTTYYQVLRAGNLNYRGIPINCSEKINDALMESLEPFDINAAEPFQTAYLAGYLADKFDVDTDVSWERVKERVSNSSAAYFFNTVNGYDTVRQDGGSVSFLKRHAKYALLPVWMLTTVWNGQTYQFAMNGQTGKFVGDLPMDKKAYALWFILTTLGAALGTFLISFLITSL